MHHHCSITAPSLHHHCPITTSSSPGGVCSVLPATALPLSSPPAGSSEALKEHCRITPDHLASQVVSSATCAVLCCIITAPALYYHHTITMSSITGGGTHTQLAPLQVPSLYLDALSLCKHCTLDAPSLCHHCLVTANRPWRCGVDISCNRGSVLI